MRVTLQVQGHLREFFPHLASATPFQFDHRVSVRELLIEAGIAPELPGSVICGGLRVDLDHVPADGDDLLLLSPMAGG